MEYRDYYKVLGLDDPIASAVDPGQGTLGDWRLR